MIRGVEADQRCVGVFDAVDVCKKRGVGWCGGAGELFEGGDGVEVGYESVDECRDAALQRG